MADFDDITGWREELKAFQATDEGKVFFGTYRFWGGDKPKAPKLPFATLLHFAEMYLRFPEIETALKKSGAWGAYLNDNPDFGRDDEGFDELCPWAENEAVYDFQRWYAMKAQLPYDGTNLYPGRRIAYKVAIGELPSLTSPETRAFAEKEFPGKIIFSDGGEND